MNNGLTVSGTGIVSLGYGSLTANDTTSGITGGSSVAAYSQFIGTVGSSVFTQSGGTNTANALVLGSNTGSSGAYILNGNGQMSANNATVGASGAGMFTQSEGTSSFAGLWLGGNTGASGTLNLSGNQCICRIRRKRHFHAIGWQQHCFSLFPLPGLRSRQQRHV